MGHEVDLPLGIQAHVGSHAGSEKMVRRSQCRHRHRLSLEIANCAHALCPKQFKAPCMHSAQQSDGRVTKSSGTSTYWMSLKPSILSSASATYCGAMQIPGVFVRRMVVTSGGAS